MASLVSTRSLGQWISLNGGTTHEVRSFALPSDSSRILVGGNFPFLIQDNLRANNLAWWDGEQWSVEGLEGGNGDTSTFGDTSPIYSLAIRGDTIYAGHLGFAWHYDQSMRNAAMLADGGWTSCGTPENQFWFLNENGRMFNGGRSDTLYGEYMPMVNEWVDGSWHSLQGSPFENTGSIYDVTYWNEDYYFVGSFLVGAARSAIRYNGVDSWTPLADGIGGNFSESVCGYGDSLYVGGFLLPGPNVQSRHIQIWDGSQWLPFFSEIDVVGRVYDIQEYAGNLYIAGGFKFGTDTTEYGLIRYDGQSICALGGFMIDGGRVMAFFNDDLYMALPTLNGQLTNEHIGYLDLATLEPDTCITVIPTAIPQAHAVDRRIEVYPNPVQDELVVRLRNGTSSAQLCIRDVRGSVVYIKGFEDSAHVRVNVSQLAKGIYTITLLGNEGYSMPVRFSKM